MGYEVFKMIQLTVDGIRFVLHCGVFRFFAIISLQFSMKIFNTRDPTEIKTSMYCVTMSHCIGCKGCQCPALFH